MQILVGIIQMLQCLLHLLWRIETKDFTVILTYVEITSSGINCMLKNLRGGKSRSGKGY